MSIPNNIMYIKLYYEFNIIIQSTPDKSDSQGTGKSVRLSEIKNIMKIRHEMRSELNGYRNMELCNYKQHKMLYSIILLTKIIIFII